MRTEARTCRFIELSHLTFQRPWHADSQSEVFRMLVPSIPAVIRAAPSGEKKPPPTWTFVQGATPRPRALARQAPPPQGLVRHGRVRHPHRRRAAVLKAEDPGAAVVGHQAILDVQLRDRSGRRVRAENDVDLSHGEAVFDRGLHGAGGESAEGQAGVVPLQPGAGNHRDQSSGIRIRAHALGRGVASSPDSLSRTARAQIQALSGLKSSWTPAQRKARAI